MSAENVELVREGFRRLRGGNIEGALTLAADDIEFLPLGAALVEGRSYEGLAGLREWQREPAWDVRSDAMEFHDFGHNVLVHGTITVVGAASNAEIKTPVSWVVTVRADKITRIEAFLDAEDATTAAHRSF